MLAVVREQTDDEPVITSRQHALVARFREAARGGSGVPMLLDGPHLVAEAIEAGLVVTDVAMAEAVASNPEMARLRRTLDVHLVASQVLDAMSPARTPSGVVALALRPEWSADAIVGGTSPLVVVAVDVQDPGNLGAIVRAVEAGGATGVFGTMGGADPFGWKALRGAMGSAFRIPIAREGTAAEALVIARAHGLRVVAAVKAGGAPMDQADLTGPLALVVGGEGAGLASEIVEGADLNVTIPMAPRVESLNVAVAAALLVYEARRQRAAPAG
jgi:TrmH family RNA methyltransferase